VYFSAAKDLSRTKPGSGAKLAKTHSPAASNIVLSIDHILAPPGQKAERASGNVPQ